ncbi:hypothetical protein [Candidatus Nitrospira bockiana]
MTVTKGTCYVLFAYDIGLSINLDQAERHMTAIKQRSRIHHKRRAPHYFDYRPAPLRVTQGAEPLMLGEFRTDARVDVGIYDFGAVSVTYRIAMDGPFERLFALSQVLYENPLLLADSHRHVQDIQTALEGMVEKPKISPYVEDYVIYHIDSAPPPELLPYSDDMARVLRSEEKALSEQQVREATSSRLSFGKNDAAIIDWNAALLLGNGMEDVQAVLEFANVELLEMRYLDQQLDEALDQAYDLLSKRMGRRFRTPGALEADLRQIAQLQVDGAIIFERVTNTLKLIGDQYLARVYRLASERFHLQAWDAGILRKLDTLDSIYGKMAGRAATRRMEVLEWIIIILIAVSITVSVMPGWSGH